MPQIESVIHQTLPTIPLRGVVLFPGSTLTFEVARSQSIAAFHAAEDAEGFLFLLCQKDPSVLEPTMEDLYHTGTVACVKHSIRLQNGNLQLIVDGISRAEALSLRLENGFNLCDIVRKTVSFEEDFYDVKRKISETQAVIQEYTKYLSRNTAQALETLANIQDPGQYADFAAGAFLARWQDKQDILDLDNPLARLDKLIAIFEHEIEVIELEGSIHAKTRAGLSKAQREIYLREQMKVIENELGTDNDYETGDDEYSEKIRKTHLPAEVEEKLLSENGKLLKMPFGTPEATVIKNYIETCLELPWGKFSKDRTDLPAAERILNEDHDGLTKVKERILEFMAVRQLAPKLDGQILCLVGPPGVGKSSIAKSIARATGRKYVRISLGGIRDEAEIRGHRKTYIGSMPGRIITAIKQAGTSNPVMLLDEVDKLTADAHGDPTGALLEVLDADQNNAFRDHFIELPYNLSECLFIATANTTATIPLPLLDRMEVIEMDSYSDDEKVSIAKNHLIPKQRKRHGLKAANLRLTDEALRSLLLRYTHEAGVRNLEREIANLCRKTAKDIVTGACKSRTVTPKDLPILLGPEKFLPDRIYEDDEIGLVNGLAWTELGGEMLRVEALSMPGNGALELTGHLGDVMKESARAAVSYIRKHAAEFGVEEDFHKKLDIHIHVPEGAIPKDGPSAGVTMATAIVSELSRRPVKHTIAMTGEITLTGRVLAIGGLKEKAMAARKAGVTTVLIPKDNLRDLPEFDPATRESLEFIGVETIADVLRLALVPAERETK